MYIKNFLEYYCNVIYIKGMMILETNIILLLIIFAAILGKADTVSIAVSILLILRLLNLQRYIYPVLEKKGVTVALIILIAAILIPIADGRIKSLNIKNSFMTWIGIAALVLSFFTTYLSGLGLKYLTVTGHAEIMPALILGSIAAAAFLGGVPVGPLITSGMLALILKPFHKS